MNTFGDGENATVERAAGLLEATSGRYRHYDVGTGQVLEAAQRVEQTFHRVTHTGAVESLPNGGADAAAANGRLDRGPG